MSLRAKRGNLAAHTTKATVVIARIVSATWEYLLHDERLEEQRRRTERERRRGEQARERAQHYRRLTERERADIERERADEARVRADAAQARADYAITELNRLRAEYETSTKALIQRLEELNNGQPGQPDADR